MTKVKDIVKLLKSLDQENYIKVASDEEWNMIFNDIEIEKDGDFGAYVIFGLSGSQEESWQDIANQERTKQ